MGHKHALAGIVGQRETQAIIAVVDEIVAKPSENLGLQLMPVKSYRETLLSHDKATGFGGLMAERVIGSEGISGASSSAVTHYWEGGAYQESVKFTEKDLISLRKLGSIGERGVTGLTSGALDFMGRAGEGLKQKLVNRLNYLAWQTLNSGIYTYQGIAQANFNYPGGNALTAATNWSIPATSTPFTDLFTIVKTNPVVFKYIVLEFIINPVTEAAILESAEARVVITNNSAARGDINALAKILYPGLPPFRVCKDAWQDQSVVQGQIVHAAAQYFVPNYQVLIRPDFSSTLYGGYGEIQMLFNMNDPSATVENPATGIYAFVDEEGLKKKKSPYVEITSGFNGGANVLRSDDVLWVTANA